MQGVGCVTTKSEIHHTLPIIRQNRMSRLYGVVRCVDPFFSTLPNMFRMFSACPRLFSDLHEHRNIQTKGPFARQASHLTRSISYKDPHDCRSVLKHEHLFLFKEVFKTQDETLCCDLYIICCIETRNS